MSRADKYLAEIEAVKDRIREHLEDGLIMLSWNETIYELPLIIEYRDPVMPPDLAGLLYFECYTDEVHVCLIGSEEPVAGYQA